MDSVYAYACVCVYCKMLLLAYNDMRYMTNNAVVWIRIKSNMTLISLISGNIRRYLKNHLFEIEKSQRSVTHDILLYINILT